MARVTISSNNLFPGPKGQKGDTGAQGPSGVIAVTSPITNSGSSTSATIGIDQSLISIAQSQVTNLTSDLAGKAGLALANTFTATQTATSFIVTGSTVPANGIYLPTANTLGLATNSTVRLRIDADGNIGIGFAPQTAFGIYYSRSWTGGATQYAMSVRGAIQSDVTGTWLGFDTSPATAAASFTLSSLIHYNASQGTKGASSTITNQFGFAVQSTLSGATNNYGFYGQLAAASGTFNTYMVGTAANYFAGQTTVGSTSLTLGSGSVAQQFGVVSQAATRVGAVIRGAASQTGNLQEWQDSAGTVLANIGSNGNLTSNSILATGVFRLNLASGTGSTAHIVNTSAGNIGLMIRGAASQTANLQEWQISDGSIRALIDANGNMSTSFAIAAGGLSSYPGRITAFTGQATSVGFVARGASSQTADLQQWQNSAGTVLARITSSGGLGVGTPTPTRKVEINNDGVSAAPLRLSNTNDNLGIEFVPNAIRHAWLVGAQYNVSNALEITPSTAVGGTTFSNPAVVVLNTGRVGIGPTAPSAKLHVTTGAAGTIGSIVQGAASQTANLQEWQNSAGSILSRVDQSGNIVSTTANNEMYRLVVTDLLTASVNFRLGVGQSLGSGSKVIAIGNALTVPSTNPTDGGVLYVEAGALKYRGSSGTVTTIANA